MNYSWKKSFVQSTEELKATDENRNAPKNMSYCFLFDIAERCICEICTVTSSFSTALILIKYHDWASKTCVKRVTRARNTPFTTTSYDSTRGRII